MSVQTLHHDIPWSTLPVLPQAAFSELVTNFLSSLDYFTSKPGLLSPQILTLSKFSLRSDSSSSANCSPSVASACRSLWGMQSMRAFRKLWGSLDIGDIVRSPCFGTDLAPWWGARRVNTGCCLLNKLTSLSASSLQAKGILLLKHMGNLWAVVQVFLCCQLLSNIPGWISLRRTDANITNRLSSWWPMVEEETVG